MASLRDEARPYFDDFKNAISWIAVWKVGRGWNVRLIWSAEYQEGSKRWHQEEKWMIDADDQEELRRILAQDPNACLINGYYLNIGPLEEMTLGSLLDGLRFQYEGGGNLAAILAQAELPGKEGC
jgi:hypothetical protein